MLVPAIAYGWWLTSIGSPVLPAHAAAPHALVANNAEPPARADVPDVEEAPTGKRVHLKTVTPDVVQAARTFLNLPMGAERTVNINGRWYVFVLEHHYHPPGYVGGPNGWHKGVTVYGLR